MKKSQSGLIYSPSDLILFMRSPFASWLERKLLEDPESLRGQSDEDAMNALLGEKGDAHEMAYLAHIKEVKGSDRVAHIERCYETAAEKTLEAMKAGYDVIFQAFLSRDGFLGFADFLVKVPGESKFGDYHYEAWDTKLSKTTRPYFITQLCCYSWMLEAIQGRLPEEIVVVLGDRQEDRIRVAAHYAYFQNLMKQFLEAQSAFSGRFEDMPDPTLVSDYGRWGEFAKNWMAQSDSLSIVANIRKSQILKLQAEGILTLQDLAETSLERVKGMAADTFTKLKAQASIQFRSRGLEIPLFEVLPARPGKGLSALPPESRLDVYFDIEGHPLMEGGLEYLWGVSCKDSDVARGKDYGFVDWWAHDREQEKRAFEGFIDWVHARWTQDPSMHVYHYASYEITAINKIANREQTRIQEVDELLAHRVFVDLYRLVLNGLLIGEPKYSIKNVEHLYRQRRETEVANGGDSIVFYERWREADGERLWRENANGLASWIQDAPGFNWEMWSELKAIRDYNIDDCESTLELVEWLRQTQAGAGISYNPEGNELLVEVEKSDRQAASAAKRVALQERQQALLKLQSEQPELKKDPIAVFLADLLLFHSRERKPKGFEYHQRLQKTPEELVDDESVLCDLHLTQQTMKDGKLSCVATFSLDQPLRKDRFKSSVIWNTNVRAEQVKFEEIDDRTGSVSFDLDPEFAEEALNQTPLHLLGGAEFINTEGLEAGLCDLAETYFTIGELSPHLKTLIEREKPKVIEGALPVTRQAYLENEDYINAIIRVVESMQETVLCIQGPPGSGKTYTARKVIASLVNRGNRIGVMSNSHAAIMNLLAPLAKDLTDYPLTKVDGYKTQKDFLEAFPPEQYPHFRYRGKMTFTKAEPYEFFRVIGATAFGFAKLVDEAPLDYLFVDEASQVALANLMVAAGAARNIILMGDQMQLEQPIQGVHPGESGQSALEYLLGQDVVIPEEKGIFLERTFRMHPAICHPISTLVYEGKLGPDPDNQNQSITPVRGDQIDRPSGIQTVWVDHQGNTQSSIEEAEVIAGLIQQLEGSTVTLKDGSSRPFTHDDVLVVAPYNMQVNLLKERLPDTISIGTIDKFQGQEAPVVIVSMAVSDLDESPRGLDFVFDKNRLNVAISRAKALVLIVASPKLKAASAKSIAQMEKVGMFLRLTDQGAD